MAISNAAVSVAPAVSKFKLSDCEFQLVRHAETGEIIGRIYHPSMVIPVAGSKRFVLNQSHDGRCVTFKSTLPDYLMMVKHCRPSNIAANRTRTYKLLAQLKYIAANPAPSLSDAWLPTPQVEVSDQAIAQLTETLTAVAAAPVEPDYQPFDLPVEVPAAETAVALKPVDSMTKNELITLAASMGIDTKPYVRKAKQYLVEAIHAEMGLAA